MTTDENPIPQVVARYRKLKVQKDAIDSAMNEVKAELRPLVEAADEQKWQDSDGYARIVVRSPSVSYSGGPVDALKTAWLKSKDAVMQSCGETLEQLRTVKAGSTYLQVK